MNVFVKSDLYRYYGNCKFSTFCKAYIKSRTFRFQCALRLAQSERIIEKIIAEVLWYLNRTKNIIQIPLKTKIGYGLYIGHGGPIVINQTAIIGNNCNLSQFVTIGSNDGQAAIIGDNVYIGPNVCIVEDVKIADNVTIGAGSVVTKDIPVDATVAGNYAKIINYCNPGRYIKNRWKNY